MIDEAFLPFHDIVARLLDMPGELVDDEAGVRSHIYECSIESPIELDVVVEADGTLSLGSVPPIYRVDTSFRPSYHRVRVTAHRSEDADGR